MFYLPQGYPRGHPHCIFLDMGVIRHMACCWTHFYCILICNARPQTPSSTYSPCSDCFLAALNLDPDPCREFHHSSHSFGNVPAVDTQLNTAEQKLDFEKFCSVLTLWWWWETCSRTWIWHNRHSTPRYCWWMPWERRHPWLQLRTTPVPALPTRSRSPWGGPLRRLPQHLARGSERQRWFICHSNGQHLRCACAFLLWFIY